MQINKNLMLVVLFLLVMQLFCACGGSGGDGDDDPIVVGVTSIELSQTDISINVGDQVTLTAKLSPANTTNKSVNWNSSQTSVATVFGNGHVTGVGEGTCVITASVDGKSAQCTVTVMEKVAVESITLSETTLDLEVGSSATLTATVSPSNAKDKTVTWISSDASVATVSNGVVKAVKAGMATITASASGKSATCMVKVKQSNGLGADINPWDENDEDYGGIVK